MKRNLIKCYSVLAVSLITLCSCHHDPDQFQYANRSICKKLAHDIQEQSAYHGSHGSHAKRKNNVVLMREYEAYDCAAR